MTPDMANLWAKLEVCMGGSDMGDRNLLTDWFMFWLN